MSWYTYYKDSTSKTKGPIDIDELKILYGSEVKDSTKVWHRTETDEKWIELRKCPHILKQIPQNAQELEALRNELKKRKQLEESQRKLAIEHSVDFWQNIKNNCTKKNGPFSTADIKKKIKNKEMTVYDRNGLDQTLLIIAAQKGAYDLAQFLINNVWAIHSVK